MQHDIHPVYGPAASRDHSTGDLVLTRSALAAREDLRSVEIDRTTYRVVDVDVSSASHPWWSGTSRTLDAESRVEVFERRYGPRDKS